MRSSGKSVTYARFTGIRQASAVTYAPSKPTPIITAGGCFHN
jgi:hypothetical protein